jgi:hypothetical protein
MHMLARAIFGAFWLTYVEKVNPLLVVVEVEVGSGVATVELLICCQ